MFEDNNYSELYELNLLSARSARFLLSSFEYENFDSSDYLYATQDDGEHWQTYALPADVTVSPSVRQSRATLIFFDGDSGLLMGRAFGERNPIYRTEDGGRSWQRVKTVTWYGQFSFIDQLHGRAVARSGDAIALVKTVNGAVSWELLKPRVVR